MGGGERDDSLEWMIREVLSERVIFGLIRSNSGSGRGTSGTWALGKERVYALKKQKEAQGGLSVVNVRESSLRRDLEVERDAWCAS